MLVGLALHTGQTLALGARDLAVIFNERDDDSRRLAEYYAKSRDIPPQHVLAVALDGDQASMPAPAFTRILRDLESRLPATIQAYALVWTRPYRVECMSITSAFAFGFDQRHCATGCNATAANPYYGSSSAAPYSDHRLRPAMLVTAGSFAAGVSLIERGRDSESAPPVSAAAFLVTSNDPHRNSRSARYPLAEKLFGQRIQVQLERSNGIAERDNIMFYFIGAKRVTNLSSLRFLPGAIADHLTSAGGVLDGTVQMSALEWLKAGATGSYGTVVEPCNFPQKFPDPAIVMGHYLNGDSLLEAYWKSVLWPGQGLFIGEPLARPFATQPTQPTQP